MSIYEISSKIVNLEWPMFQSVNGDSRVDCQNNREMFDMMRRAQFDAWSEAAAVSYLCDLEDASEQGRNLMREKYIWMMETTEPETFHLIRDSMPVISEEKDRLVKLLWHKYCRQTERLRAAYPVLAMGGRPLLAENAGDRETSIETYQVGEFKTYSEATLRLLLEHLKDLEAQGIDLVAKIQENSVLCLGYDSLEQAEAAMSAELTYEVIECGDCGCGCEF